MHPLLFAFFLVVVAIAVVVHAIRAIRYEYRRRCRQRITRLVCERCGERLDNLDLASRCAVG